MKGRFIPNKDGCSKAQQTEDEIEDIGDPEAANIIHGHISKRQEQDDGEYQKRRLHSHLGMIARLRLIESNSIRFEQDNSNRVPMRRGHSLSAPGFRCRDVGDHALGIARIGLVHQGCGVLLAQPPGKPAALVVIEEALGGAIAIGDDSALAAGVTIGADEDVGLEVNIWHERQTAESLF